MTALGSLLFIAMIPIDCKITNFPYTCISIKILLGVCLSPHNQYDYKGAWSNRGLETCKWVMLTKFIKLKSNCKELSELPINHSDTIANIQG